MWWLWDGWPPWVWLFATALMITLWAAAVWLAFPTVRLSRAESELSQSELPGAATADDAE
jgi:hypothetical protein